MNLSSGSVLLMSFLQNLEIHVSSAAEVTAKGNLRVQEASGSEGILQFGGVAAHPDQAHDTQRNHPEDRQILHGTRVRLYIGDRDHLGPGGELERAVATRPSRTDFSIRRCWCRASISVGQVAGNPAT